MPIKPIAARASSRRGGANHRGVGIPQMAPRVSALFSYPIKSCGPVRLDAARVDAFGLQLDRNWAIVDPDGKLITLREVPRLVLLKPQIVLKEAADGDSRTALEVGGTMVLKAPGMPDLPVLFPHPAGPDATVVQVDVWGERSDALDEGDAVADWFEKYMGRPGRLVVKDPRQVRTHSGLYDDENQPPYVQSTYPSMPSVGTAFADCYPFLLVTAAAVREVDAKVKAKDPSAREVKAENFRPNIVVDDTEAWTEDGWLQVRIGGTTFDVLTRATRCVATCVDTEIGEIQKEPLKTLQSYRRVDPNAKYEACFGQWLQQHTVGGTIKVGDEVEVLKTGTHAKKKKAKAES
ncbi:hypothetical protein DFJ74DRAFT_652695 [Hyaloraphidium curvatum]|nr:hypothetical protein DFJ74DRAFT_652695 [Hyaloraphidium curvatum]